MCTNQKRVINPYTGQELFVKCGKCESCLQEKADRLTSRLNNHSTDYSKVCIFSTLTYKEEFVPYVLKSDLENTNCYEIPVYRDYSVRRYKGLTRFYRSNFLDFSLHGDKLCSFSLVNKETGEVNREYIAFHPNLYKKGRGFHPYKMGVIVFKDFQDFKKRLRINLQRELGARFRGIEVFGTSEYGETFGRPHFHVLVYTDQCQVGQVMSAICDSWKFASNDDIRRSTQLGLKPAAYVSSYVNCSADIPKCLTALAPTKHSFSPSIGVEVPDFSLLQILEKVNCGSLSYRKQSTVNGVPTVFDVPIPKYVINRYFPLFKGLCRLSNDEVVNLLRFPQIGFINRKFEGIGDYNKRYRDGNLVNDIHLNYVRIKNARSRYVRDTHKHEWDFALDYMRVWNCYKNTILKLSFAQDIPMTERYDNILDLVNGHVRNDSLSSYLQQITETNPNGFSSVKARSLQMQLKYLAKQKCSKINNYVRSALLQKDL